MSSELFLLAAQIDPPWIPLPYEFRKLSLFIKTTHQHGEFLGMMFFARTIGV